MRLSFTQSDHKYWESNIKTNDDYPMYTITTDYKNELLKPEFRAKNPIYMLHLWDNENLIDSFSFKSLNQAKKYAKDLHLTK